MPARYFALLGIFFCAFGFVYAEEETIPTFDARLTVQSDRRVEVKEKIVYDFKDRERHGIYRVIPYSYQAKTATYEARISSVMVYDGEGNPLPFIESKGNGELTLKIGDPEAVVSGVKTYVLSYVVEGPFLFFPEQDEFYWNVTGVWQNGIGEANVLIDLPVGAQVTDATCFRGIADEKRTCEEGERLLNDRQAGYRASARDLASGEGLAVAVIFPKGVIAHAEKPWNGERSLGARLAALPYAERLPLLPTLVPLTVLGYLGRAWYLRVRDPLKYVRVPRVETPPEGLSPALAGVVYREGIGPRDIAAELVQLAVEGHLRIHRVDRTDERVCTTDYILECVNTERPTDPLHALMLERLFVPAYLKTERVGARDVRGVSLATLYGASQTVYDAVVDRLYEEVVSRGYVFEQPEAVRRWYYFFGASMSVLGGGAYGFGFAAFGVATCVLGVAGILAGRYMPMQTTTGVRLRRSFEGFRRHLETREASIDQVEAGPQYARYLPYAIALDVDRAWAVRYAALASDAVEWFTRDASSAAGEVTVSSLVHAFSNDVQAVFACSVGATPRLEASDRVEHPSEVKDEHEQANRRDL